MDMHQTTGHIRSSLFHQLQLVPAMRLLLHFLFLWQWFMCTASIGRSCICDQDQDERSRVTCAAAGLNTIPPDVNHTTQVLNFTHNTFEFLSWSSYQSFPALYQLDLSHNLLSALPDNVSSPLLHTLKVLRLSGNALKELRNNAFTAAPGLMEIYLQQNRIEHVSEQILSNLPHLEVLDLSHNLIFELPLNLLKSATTTSLKTFDLEDNRLTLLPNGFFEGKPEIPYVYLSHNPWRCSCEVGYLSVWLDDQASNVYIHTGPSSITNDPESVVCDSPIRLKGRAIIDLEEEDYCVPLISETSVVPGGDFLPNVPADTSQPTSLSTAVLMQVQTTGLHVTPGATSVSVATSESAALPTSLSSTPPQTTTNVQTTRHTTALIDNPIIVSSTLSAWPKRHLTSSSAIPINHPYESESFSESTPTTHPPESALSTKHSSTSTLPTRHPSISPALSTSAPTAPPGPPSSVVTTSPDQSMSSKQAKSLGGVSLGGHYCWWLFVGYLCLCVVLALWLFCTSLWLLRMYRQVYLPLSHRKIVSCPPGEAVFRSVLFVSVSNEAGDAVIANRPGWSRVGQENEVFRKTLRRDISKDGQMSGWMMEQDERLQMLSLRETKTRFSLILREEQVEHNGQGRGPRERLVGKWEGHGREEELSSWMPMIGNGADFLLQDNSETSL